MLMTVSAFALIFPEVAGSGVAYGGVIVLLALLLPFGLGVFLSVDRRSLTATRRVVWFCFAVAGLSVFGVISNVGEIIFYGTKVAPVALTVFVLAGFGVATYFVASGVSFQKWQRQLESACGMISQSSGTQRSQNGILPEPNEKV